MNRKSYYKKNKNRVICMILAMALVLVPNLPGSFSVFAENSDDTGQDKELHEVLSDKTDGAELTVLSSSKDSDVEIKEAEQISAEEGLEVVGGYLFTNRDEKAEENIWVKAEVDSSAELEPNEALSIYSVEDDKVSDMIVEDISESDEAYEIDGEVTGIALVKDSGFRHLTLEVDTRKEERSRSEEEESASEEELLSSEESLDIDENISTEEGLESEESSSSEENISTEEISSSEDSSTTEESLTTEETPSDLGGYELINFEDIDSPLDYDRVITLDGMMPKNAVAVAKEVTDASEADQSSVVAAYDISILDGEEEYQPGKERPVRVEISDSRIDKNAELTLWHIKDDGVREQIESFSLEAGRISFDAEGFSVYEIVSGPDKYEQNSVYVKSIGEFTGTSFDKGFLLHYGSSSFFTNSLNNNGCFVEVSNMESASVWYFEDAGQTDTFYIYTYIDGVKNYIYQASAGNNEITLSPDNKTELIISNKAGTVTAPEGSFYYKHALENRWLQHSGRGGGIRFFDNANNATNTQIKAIFVSSLTMPDDVYGLDGKTTGLVNASISGNTAYAMMAKKKTDKVLQLLSLKVKNDTVDHSGSLLVAENADITEWTFHSVSKDVYTVTTNVGGVTKYLQLTSDALVLADDSPTEFTVVAKDGKIKLVSNGKAVYCDSANGFRSGNDSDDAKYWLSFTKASRLKDEDFVTYSAGKVSISEVPDGHQVIVYTRIWNDTTKSYEFYAVDHDGTLYPCYERGDNIMWIGNQFNTLLWDFTEYHNDDGKPNNFYELKNHYSEKYLAPKFGAESVISNDKIGLNLPGRKDEEYYSDILAWDETYYGYASLKSDAEKKNAVAGTKSEALTFYFAVMDPIVSTLTEVETIDNSEFGIKMKMIDFTDKPVNGNNDQDDILGDYTTWNNHKKKPLKGILSTDLKTDANDNTKKYPTTKADKSLGELYQGAYDVNHLFIKSVYNASGYFEYDSCQNFATLKQEDGSIGRNFTVYKELGTSNAAGKNTLKHGQFMPYDTIAAGVYSTKNPLNIYDSSANPDNAAEGLLSEDDPRKYEKLHSVSGGATPDYYFGMELEASFVQTPSGMDKWGHDIIFEFTGDDDFWLYVDDELVIDLGGIHSALPGSVNFRTGTVNVNGEIKTLRQVFEENYRGRNPSATDAEVNAYLAKFFAAGEDIFMDYTSHTMKIFYMERGAGASNLHMRFNLSYVVPGHVIFSKEVKGSQDLDFNIVQYPYQIWYKDEEFGQAKLLTNTDQIINVTYQNSTHKVEYASKYTPPGSTQEYDSVFFEVHISTERCIRKRKDRV